MRDLTKPQRFLPAATSFVHDQKDLQNALAGYRLFFEAFIVDEPSTYLSFDAFAYKHYAVPSRPKPNQVFAYQDGRAVATEWYMDLPLIYGGRVYSCVHGGDVCALEEGRGLPFLRMHAAGEKLLRSQGYEIRLSAPNSNSMKFIERFGGRVLGDHNVMEGNARDVVGPCLALAAEACDVSVACHDACPFAEADYRVMNGSALPIRALRSETYFAFRVDGFVERHFSYVVARSQGTLVGYLVLRWDACGRATVFDWDLFADDDAGRARILARMLVEAAPLYEYLFVPQLSEPAGEVGIFARCGFSLVLDAEGKPVGDKFVVTPYAEGLDDAFLDFRAWRQRLIDKDFGLNATRGY